MAAPPAPVPIFLCGSKPGVFDPAQPSRLLRFPDSTLLFASFNPLTGSGPPLSAATVTPARRIVVEAPQANDLERPHWFSVVPDAVLAPGVTSEGKWPRVVNYCGRYVVCDQNQWDIHKLDPLYHCFVAAPGMYSTITMKAAQFPTGGGIHPGKREPSFQGDQPLPISSTFSAAPASAAFAEFARSTSVPPTLSFTPPLAHEQDRTRQTGPVTEDAAELVPRQTQAAVEAGGRGLVAAPTPERLQRSRLERRQEWIPWNPRRAIDRYLAVSQQFDSARFSYEHPVDPLFIPWPVLISPLTFQWDRVDRDLVEAFFQEASRQMLMKDFGAFLRQSQMRFHPDRLRVRGVFRTRDGELAQALEHACLTVIQVLNPICDDFRHRY